jgi:hypothetical protein
MLNASTILAALLTLAPRPSAHPLPGWSETLEQHRARMASIAADVAAVARTTTEAAILLGLAHHESGYAPDTDEGAHCYRGPGFKMRCDGGRAVSIWQMQDGDADKREALRTSRRAAATEALRRALGSVHACRGRGPALALYASGSCARGHKAARELDASVRRALRAIDAAGRATIGS